ncbi:MAG: sensor histidine kinase [Ilumatobacter sp.]|nr:sensor histidine kinase [Ilumatobacter sp.]MDJ0769867.1 sensor histidine kinase [Ilumatobacter sp.]
MSKLTELVRERTTLDRDQVAHLNRLVSEWGTLADLSFSDLLLYVPVSDGNWITVAQVRPATAQTLFESDWVGSLATRAIIPLLDQAFESEAVRRGEIDLSGHDDATRLLAVPVVRGGRPIAVMAGMRVELSGRRPGELERAYGDLFDRFVDMIVVGAFPFEQRVGDSSAAPRVGDGVVWLDAEAEVQYVSPNANSALHRVGIQASAVGMRLAELGFHDGPVRQAFERGEPVIEEFEQGPDVTLLCRCVPFVGQLQHGDVSGALLLIRDVTELRKRDRLLLTKDATIREIHHRVKNNLQTISSLLRLQARRLTHPEAISAVGESVRRIRTIALVHEALSRDPGDEVTFVEIVRPLLRLAEEGLQSPDRPVRFSVRGDGGRIPAAIATPLSVVLTELLQNAVDHGFPEGSGGGSVVVHLRNLGHELHLSVIDDGRGVEAGFKLEDATGLGLSIVRTLVTTELNGTITMRPPTRDDLRLPPDSQAPHGTVIELVVPMGDRP